MLIPCPLVVFTSVSDWWSLCRLSLHPLPSFVYLDDLLLNGVGVIDQPLLLTRRHVLRL